MIDQIGLTIFGLTAVYLSQSESKELQKWACISGLCGEPFWFYAAWKADQWGIMILAFVYTVGWSRGVYNFWIKPRRQV